MTEPTATSRTEHDDDMTLALIDTLVQRPATRRKGASEVRVRVVDAGNGNGAAVDVRKYITKPATGKITRTSVYTGPTKAGLWLQPGEAYALAEALVRAALDAEERQLEAFDAGELSA